MAAPTTAVPVRAASVAVASDPARREQLARRIRLLVRATIAWNTVEAAVALAAGATASSVALVGFGLDSVVEVSSAAAVAWQFAARDAAVREQRERRALRLVAVSFLALAAYLLVDSTLALGQGDRPDSSPAGIALAAVSVVVMPVLSLAQRRAGRELGSASAVADSRQTLLCSWLSAVLLVGLGVSAAFGWTWADPATGLAIGAVAAREGWQAWHGSGCCVAPPAGAPASGPEDCCG